MADVYRGAVVVAYTPFKEEHSADLFMTGRAEVYRGAVVVAYPVPVVQHLADVIAQAPFEEHSADLIVGTIEDVDIGGEHVRVLRASHEPDIGGYNLRVLRASHEPDIGGYVLRVLRTEPEKAHAADLNLIFGVNHRADVTIVGSYSAHQADLFVVQRLDETHDADLLPVDRLDHSHSADLIIIAIQVHGADILVSNATLFWNLVDETNGVVASGIATTNIATSLTSATWTGYSYDLSEAEAAQITNYATLQVEFYRAGPAAISWVEMEIPYIDRFSRPHYADILIEAQALGHGMDLFMSKLDNPETHSADVLVVNQYSESHSADVFLATIVSVSHTQDVYLVTASWHQADMLLSGVGSEEHSADLFVAADGIFHDADVRLVSELNGSSVTFEVWAEMTGSAGTEVTGDGNTAESRGKSGKRRRIGRRKI